MHVVAGSEGPLRTVRSPASVWRAGEIKHSDSGCLRLCSRPTITQGSLIMAYISQNVTNDDFDALITYSSNAAFATPGE